VSNIKFHFTASQSLHRAVKKEGVWAWDCVHKEPVLVFPVVLALLGDNPMQSEFACHIGMRGKLFCGACWVKGSDALDFDDLFINATNNDQSDVESQASSAAEEEGGSAHSSVPVTQVEETTNTNIPKKKRGRFKESMSAMINRVMSFIKVRFLAFHALTGSPMSS